MKAIGLVMCLGALVAGCSYSHIDTTRATFDQVGPVAAGDAVQPGPLVLRMSRHLDTVMRGPDTDEDQVLVLTVRNFKLNQQIAVPSDNVSAEFAATRFGPRSTGTSFRGYFVVKKIGRIQATGYVHVDVTASTESGSYTQQAKFRGNFVFYREDDTL